MLRNIVGLKMDYWGQKFFASFVPTLERLNILFRRFESTKKKQVLSYYCCYGT